MARRGKYASFWSSGQSALHAQRTTGFARPYRAHGDMKTLILLAILVPVGVSRAQAPTSPVDTARARVVAGYCASWNESDRAKRDARLQEVWDANGEYSDPTPVRVTGRSELSRHIEGFLRQVAGGQIRCSAPQVHHESARFTWEIFAANGSSVVAGMDYVDFAADGRIRRIVGFFGPLPSVSRQ